MVRARNTSMIGFQDSFFFESNTPPPLLEKYPFFRKRIQALHHCGIYLGTSSWKFPGWKDLVYNRHYASELQFQKNCLEEYTELFTSVGVDFTFYNWPQPNTIESLLPMVPENFPLCFKVTDRITLPYFPSIPRFGQLMGQRNPEFLDANVFQKKFLQPLAKLRNRQGLFLFTFSRLHQEHLPSFRQFFQSIPRDIPYAIEMREPQWINKSFYRLLTDLDLSPVFNAWTNMPPLKLQWNCYQSLGATLSQPIVVRAMVQPDTSHEQSVARFSPFQEVQRHYEDFHEDVQIILSCCQTQQQKGFFLIGNGLEGCAPWTVAKILRRWEE